MIVRLTDYKAELEVMTSTLVYGLSGPVPLRLCAAGKRGDRELLILHWHCPSRQ